MFEWLFGKRSTRRPTKVVVEVNVNVSGTINVEQERGNSLEQEFRENKRPIITQPKEKVKINREPEVIPNLSKLPKPKVEFGQEE